MSNKEHLETLRRWLLGTRAPLGESDRAAFRTAIRALEAEEKAELHDRSSAYAIAKQQRLQEPMANALNAYAKACGGSPERYVYGNVPRMDAVSAASRVIEAAVADGIREAERVPEARYRTLAEAAQEAWKLLADYPTESSTERFISERVPVASATARRLAEALDALEE